MGTTNRILSTLMMFGMWRTGRSLSRVFRVLVMQLEALNPIFAGGNRLQSPIQRQRTLQ
jgi:hypothetical protein